MNIPGKLFGALDCRTRTSQNIVTYFLQFCELESFCQRDETVIRITVYHAHGFLRTHGM